MEGDDPFVTGKSGDGYVLQALWFQPMVAAGGIHGVVRSMGHDQCSTARSGIGGATRLCEKEKDSSRSGSWRPRGTPLDSRFEISDLKFGIGKLTTDN